MSYSERRKEQYIRRISLPNKEKFYRDLINIEHSWSGRMDTNIGNTFIMEAEQQLVNALEVFELGYFDCAYYSLRSAIDISTTMVFLCDLDEDVREALLSDWKNAKDFPTRGNMIKKLSQNGEIFADMIEKMPNFFAFAKALNEELNKYVHKQGMRHFYVSRNHPVWGSKSQDEFIHKFESYFIKCTGVVAVMRLAFDPFPVLLMDEEILYRCFDSLTEPYRDEFVREYIGEQNIEDYKKLIYIS